VWRSSTLCLQKTSYPILQKLSFQLLLASFSTPPPPYYTSRQSEVIRLPSIKYLNDTMTLQRYIPSHTKTLPAAPYIHMCMKHIWRSSGKFLPSTSRALHNLSQGWHTGGSILCDFMSSTYVSSQRLLWE